MNQDGADISLQDALDATNSQVIRQMKKPNIVDIPVGPVLPTHLPIQPVGAAPPRLRHAFDVVGEVEFSHSKKEELNHYARDGAFQRFPEPFGFQRNPDVGVEMQLALIPNSERSKFYLVKHFIFKEQDWPERLIKEALRNLMSDVVPALPVDDFPLTLVDVDPTNILEKFFPHFNEKALGMHGVPNVGKTPLARIVAMAMSRDRPDIFDDGTLSEQPPRKIKGFCDVGNTVLTKERWGAAKFPQGQMRFYVSNELQSEAEPLSRSSGNSISHKTFLEILEPAWMKGTGVSDITAVLKRTCLLVFTDNYIYYRPATDKQVWVERILLDDSKSVLRQSSGPKYNQYRTGYRAPADPAHVEWERAWMASVMDNRG
ncbi:unnamed protein product [Symbiodinium sp. CCMP2592]|nr:unnamed protein product [Symbiodinium sp. CCMP2592]